MKGAALGLSWEIVARIRWLIFASGVYFVLACVVVALVPGALRVPELGVGLASPLLLLVIGIASATSFSEGADLRTRRGGYSRRLLVLPASSFTLASVPILLGAVLLALTWVAVVVGLLYPCGANAPVVMTALALVTTVALLQALTWTPFPLPWVRGILVALGCYGVLGGPFLLESLGVDNRLLCYALVGLFASCYAVAVVGVRLGRRGVFAGDRVQLDRDEVGTATVPLIPFSSPLRGQLWLEWRYLGWSSFCMMLVFVLGFLPLFHFMDLAWRRPFMLAAVGPFAEQMGAAWLSVQMVLIVPVAFSMFGGDSSRQSAPGKPGLSPFYATRAIGIPEVVKAKLLSTAVFVAALWGQLLTLTLGWAAATGNLGDMMERLGDVAGFPGAGPAVLAGGVLGCCVVNWLWLIGNLWVGLSGRPWVSGAMMLFTFVVVLPAIVFISKGWRPSWYPWLVAAVVVGLAWKVVAVGWVSRRLVNRGYARPRVLATLGGGWMILVGALASLAAWIFPGGWLTFAGVVLVIPLATSLLAPVALAWDRHR